MVFGGFSFIYVIWGVFSWFFGVFGGFGGFCADFSSANLGEVLARPQQAQRSEHNGKID